MFHCIDLSTGAASVLATDIRAAFRRACDWFDDPSNPTFYAIAGVLLLALGIADGVSRLHPRRKS